MSVADAVLEISPDSELEFTLSAAKSMPHCEIHLAHSRSEHYPIAFKIKTTQPRRYLVRPNHGLIRPGEGRSIQILMVEREKDLVLHNPQLAVNDKFLIQSVAVLDADLQKSLVDYDQLSALWASLGASQQNVLGTTSAVAHKKLLVRHVVVDNNNEGDEPEHHDDIPEKEPVQNLSRDQLVEELSSLRRKYDELVKFSVSVTAERDLLNNSLEQSKRELLLHRSSDNGIVPNNNNTRYYYLLMVVVALVAFWVGMQASPKLSSAPPLVETSIPVEAISDMETELLATSNYEETEDEL